MMRAFAGCSKQFFSFLFLCFFLCCSVFLVFRPAYSADGDQKPIATAVALRGEVMIRSGKGESRKLAVKDPLFLDDTIWTGPRGRLQIMFLDNTIYSLGGNTEMKLKDFSWDPEKKKGALNTEVKDGVFRVMGGIIAKTSPEKFTTETQVATIGIRGSMYTSSYNQANGLLVVFEGGKGVTVTNDVGTVLITDPGYQSQVMSRQSPASEPKMMSGPDASRLYIGLQAGRKGGPVVYGQSKSVRLPPPVFTGKDAALLKSEGAKGNVGAETLSGLTAAVEARPGHAAEVLREAVREKDVPVGDALDAVLHGMVNTDRQQFDAVIKEAIGYGLTVEKAREIVDRLKSGKGVCR